MTFAGINGNSTILTAVVTKALQAELDRRERDKAAEVERMLAIGREIRAHMREPVSSDTSDLFDEDGMPL